MSKPHPFLPWAVSAMAGGAIFVLVEDFFELPKGISGLAALVGHGLFAIGLDKIALRRAKKTGEVD